VVGVLPFSDVFVMFVILLFFFDVDLLTAISRVGDSPWRFLRARSFVGRGAQIIWGLVAWLRFRENYFLAKGGRWRCPGN
jgi:hypothetical protein